MKKLLTITPADTPVDLALLLLRVGASIFMIHHGYGKMQHFDEMQYKFIEFLGLSGSISLCLTIFAEVFCSLAIMAGFLTRFSLIPLIITMLVAVIVGHAGDVFGKGEPATIYLVIYLTLFMSGPGRYSLDGAFFGTSRK